MTPEQLREREIIDAKREGYVRRWCVQHIELHHMECWSVFLRLAEREAAAEFPYPKVARPRIATLSHYEWRVVDGQPEFRLADPIRSHDFRRGDMVTAELVTLLSDLLADPTIEVDA